MKDKSISRELPLDAQVCLSCREIHKESVEYSSLSDSGLEAGYSIVNGDGSALTPFFYRFKIKNNLPKKWTGVIRINISTNHKQGRFFLPAFLYGRNRAEEQWNPEIGLFPRLREGEISTPYSPYWMVRSDRLSHPVSMMFLDNIVFGISASPYFVKTGNAVQAWLPLNKGEFYKYNGFCCSVENGSSIGYTIGYENAPYLYIIAESVKERETLGQNCISLEPGEELDVPCYIYAFNSEDERGINNIIRDVHNRFHESPRIRASSEQGIEDISHAIFKDSYISEIKNYSTQVFLENGQLRKNPLASISWTGGVEVATPLLMAAIRLKNQEMRIQALECIQNIIDNSLNTKSGLPFDAFDEGRWTTKGWWDESLSQSGHSSYLVGQALYYILKAYDYEKKFNNAIHSDWLKFAEEVLARIEKTKNADGAYPYLWSAENGEGIDYDGFSGCWCLASNAYLAKLKKDTSLLNRCFESEVYYFKNYITHMECYGTPHDTWKAVDSEGVLAYIKTVKLLHEETGDDKYLILLKDALEYEFTFKFCYNSPIKVPPLGKLGWSSSGGSVTSTCNPHIHPMSNNVLDELLYYYNITGDRYMKERLSDTLNWGLQTYSRFDGEYDFGKKGWMSERFCHSEGLLVEKYADGSPSSTWFCFLPWGASNILEGMCGDIYDCELK